MNETLRNFIVLVLWVALPNVFLLLNIDPFSKPLYRYIFLAFICWLPVLSLFLLIKKFVLMSNEEKKELFKKEVEKFKFSCKKGIKDLKNSVIGLISLVGLVGLILFGLVVIVGLFFIAKNFTSSSPMTLLLVVFIVGFLIVIDRLTEIRDELRERESPFDNDSF